MTMNSLSGLAKEVKDVVRPYGDIDVLLLYGIAGGKLKKFLHGKELASKVWLPSGNIKYFLNRGSNKPKLFIEDFVEAITPEFLEVRSKHHLKDVEKQLTEKQKLVWSYFPPRKLMDFFYAANCEGAGKPIDRLFFDMDRGEGVPLEAAQRITKAFCEIASKDENLTKLIGKTESFVSWTGSSFHVYIMLDKPRPGSFYDKYFMFSKNDPLASFTGRWAEQIRTRMKTNVAGGHEKIAGFLSIDPSQTPSGKLARVPLGSLHMADARTIDGVSMPVDEKALANPKLAGKLKTAKPKYVIENIDKLAGLLAL